VTAAAASLPGMESRLRVALMAEDASAAWVRSLEPVLSGAAMDVSVTTGPTLGGALESADVALVGGWRGDFSAGHVAALRTFIRGSRGRVVLRPSRPRGTAGSGCATEVIGGTAKGPFADGAPMQVIDLFPHPIIAGVREFETDRPMERYTDLPRDSDILMEGIVGEEAVPMGWVRRVGQARIVHLPAIDGATTAHAAGQRLVTQAVLWAARRDVPAAMTSVQRTFMPDAIPGAFAITLPQGPGLCFDPARGGVNYAWDGDFVDLHPRWVTKRGEPARLSGAVFYRESDPQPWRDGAGKPAEFQFLGYQWKGRWVELHYTVGGREVREQFRPLSDGSGFAREFTVGRGPPLTLMLGEPGAATMGVRGAEMRGDRVNFTGQEAGAFTVEIRLPGAGAGGAR
jgi:hypothetical protein